eukprot:TRINITY_DN21390_c0_g2_i8.p3 TRINITY_DN21390_c0_g2~~TRINITY_DN21390_c0_g2_i8.p3  ORF type:complete len:105 (-),score=15.99 TRINITY_DN21390_c0_g2_i8:624-938(-)
MQEDVGLTSVRSIVQNALAHYLADKDKHGDHWTLRLSQDSPDWFDALHSRLADYKAAHPERVAQLLEAHQQSSTGSSRRQRRSRKKHRDGMLGAFSVPEASIRG